MSARYTTTAIVLHWLMALLIVVVFPLGLYMHDLKLSPLKLQLYSYHKWIGITLLLLAVLRVLWRSTHTPPPLPVTMARWQKRAGSAVHLLLYVLLLLVPLSGWLMSSAKGVQTVWFGLLPLPDLVGRDKALGNLLGSVHESLNYLLLLLVLVHILAALKHRYVDRDEVMNCMLPGKSLKGNRS
ncbi:MAG: cytochrome b [Gallionella sp.]|nr:cytochrome b [Gallionella sp.]